jgi:uncharacterized SAM-binding protein YcdF (DUF218 family)
MISGIQAAACRRFFECLLNPMCWLFLILLGLIIYLLGPHQTRREKRAGIILLLLWLIFFAVSTPWLPNIMIARLENQFSRIKQVDTKIQWVVVLGGGVQANLSLPPSETLSNASLRRVFEGVRLYEALPHAKLILSGGSKYGVQYAEAIQFDVLAAALNVPKSNRIREIDSVNTADEARLIKPLVGETPFYLVTSALHMPRSMQLFEQQGLHPIAAPCHYFLIESEAEALWVNYLPDAKNLLRFNVAWHECLGRVWVFFKKSITQVIVLMHL